MGLVMVFDKLATKILLGWTKDFFREQSLVSMLAWCHAWASLLEISSLKQAAPVHFWSLKNTFDSLFRVNLNTFNSSSRSSLEEIKKSTTNLNDVHFLANNFRFDISGF